MLQAAGESAASAGEDLHDEEAGPWHLQENHGPARTHHNPELELRLLNFIYSLLTSPFVYDYVNLDFTHQ